MIILDIGRGNEISNNSCWVGQLHPLSKASGPNGFPHIKVKQASRGEQLNIIDFPLIFLLDWETLLLLWPCTRCCIVVLHNKNKKNTKRFQPWPKPFLIGPKLQKLSKHLKGQFGPPVSNKKCLFVTFLLTPPCPYPLVSRDHQPSWAPNRRREARKLHPGPSIQSRSYWPYACFGLFVLYKQQTPFFLKPNSCRDISATNIAIETILFLERITTS